jgi:hypothetical protein
LAQDKSQVHLSYGRKACLPCLFKYLKASFKVAYRSTHFATLRLSVGKKVERLGGSDQIVATEIADLGFE